MIRGCLYRFIKRKLEKRKEKQYGQVIYPEISDLEIY